MGKQSRVIAQKAKDKQQQTVKKPKPVKTNLKRLNERVRDRVEQIDKVYHKNEEQMKKQEPTVETPKRDDQTNAKQS